MNSIYYFVLEYFILRRLWTMGYMSFNNYKRIISYSTGIYNIYTIRKIFIHLVDKGFFIKKKNEKRSYSYMFIGPSGINTDSQIINNITF